MRLVDNSVENPLDNLWITILTMPALRCIVDSIEHMFVHMFYFWNGRSSILSEEGTMCHNICEGAAPDR